MKNYIGLDAHSSSCTFCVMNEKGVVIDEIMIATNGRLLRNYLRSIGGEKILTFEECELSGWLYEILREEVDEVLVCNPVANRDYKKNKTDKLDAKKLANLLRGNFLVSVFHDGSAKERLRHLMSGYQDIVDEGVRLKNRYKSLFRKEGQWVRGEAIYNDENLLEGLKRPENKFVGTRIYKILEQLEEIRAEYLERIKTENKKFKEIKILKTIPGIKEIQAAKILSQIIDAKRFRNKFKFFSYCGLVRHKRISNERIYGSEKIHGNRILKCVYKMAGKSALSGDNVFKKIYEDLQRKGVSGKNAYNAVCRKIAEISLSMLKNNRRFDADFLEEKVLIKKAA